MRNTAMKLLIINTRQPQVGRYWGSPGVVKQVSEALALGGFAVLVVDCDTREDVEREVRLHRPAVVFPNGYRLLGDPNKPYITEVLDS